MDIDVDIDMYVYRYILTDTDLHKSLSTQNITPLVYHRWMKVPRKVT